MTDWLNARTAPMAYRRDKCNIFQIYYNEATRLQIDTGFIALDNSGHERSDWYEFWPMVRYFQSNPPQADEWYGFLSPNFTKKVGIDSVYVYSMLEAHCSSGVFDGLNVLIDWSQAAYFQNSVEQGSHFHPGLSEVFDAFMQEVGWPVRLAQLIGHADNTVFCNYIIANGAFWQNWCILANALVRMIEDEQHPLHAALTAPVQYVQSNPYAPMFVFVQERLVNLLLTLPYQNVILSAPDSIADFIFKDTAENRELLRACNDAKKAKDWQSYQEARQKIELVK